MFDFLQYLRSGNADAIDVGVIQEKIRDGVFRVRVNGKSMSINSAIDDDLKTGDQVIISRNKYSRYIVASPRNLKSHKETEVIIDG